MVGASSSASCSTAATSLAAIATASFGSCMQGWHYRCLGVDP
ncbi:unnamed protein product [Spirodela intermedia]|uniref:Uncharacterized protein n=1 Tax=Spirodela intermedia TaxID=51605 RepID=A0A7I8K8Q6_SPIIN|nr:unnamed protein product [Spirodela intermedia]